MRVLLFLVIALFLIQSASATVQVLASSTVRASNDGADQIESTNYVTQQVLYPVINGTGTYNLSITFSGLTGAYQACTYVKYNGVNVTSEQCSNTDVTKTWTVTGSFNTSASFVFYAKVAGGTVYTTNARQKYDIDMSSAYTLNGSRVVLVGIIQH